MAKRPKHPNTPRKYSKASTTSQRPCQKFLSFETLWHEFLTTYFYTFVVPIQDRLKRNCGLDLTNILYVTHELRVRNSTLNNNQ
mmetsp:Transcript_17523/g.36033  ORF Transcript_17523/g.36033 Transcript_17523/m.36033 type:complete len:84 (-) Transcript_17523:59-310(-)